MSEKHTSETPKVGSAVLFMFAIVAGSVAYHTIYGGWKSESLLAEALARCDASPRAICEALVHEFHPKCFNASYGCEAPRSQDTYDWCMQAHIQQDTPEEGDTLKDRTVE